MGGELREATLGLDDTIGRPMENLTEAPPPPLAGSLVDASLTVATLAAGTGCIYACSSLVEMGYIDPFRLTKVLSVAAPIITIMQYVAPFPVAIDAIKRMTAQNMPTQVFQSQAVCNILSLAYGIQSSNFAVLVTNLFGLATQVLFLSIDHYLRSFVSPSWTMYALKLCISMNITLYTFAKLVPITLLGHAITLFNIVLFACPLSKLGHILRTRDASSLPTGMTVISVANNGIWVLYALMIKDAVVMLPSLLGYLLSGFQVLVILWCRGTLPYDLEFLLLAAAAIRARIPSRKVRPLDAPMTEKDAEVGERDALAATKVAPTEHPPDAMVEACGGGDAAAGGALILSRRVNSVIVAQDIISKRTA